MQLKEVHTVPIECEKCHEIYPIIIQAGLGVQLRVSDVQEALHHKAWYVFMTNGEIAEAICPECCDRLKIERKCGGCERK